MSISSIEIRNSSGTKIHEFTSNFTLAAKADASQGGCNSTEMTLLDSDTHLIELSSSLYNDIYQGALDKLIEDGCWYVTSINGLGKTDDYNFYIMGSECSSIYPPAASTNTLSVVDLCPACSTCEDLLVLRKQVEYYKKWLNLLKDVNLYNDTVTNSRLTYLKNKSITYEADTPCDKVIKGMDKKYNEEISLKGLRLLQQYVTAVHMWNYIVSKNNTSDEITTAPEDSTGLSIQTKRALPSCGGSSTISCEIVITLLSGQENLSVYVPTPVGEFKPFKAEEASQKLTLSVEHTSATTKTIKAAAKAVNVAGTFLINIKLLPFIYTELWLLGKDGARTARLDIQNMSWIPGSESVTEEIEAGTKTTTTYYLNVEADVQSKTSPTATDYSTSKSYPSKSATTTNKWQIDIKWKIVSDTTEESLETYYFYTDGVRTYMSDIFMADQIATTVLDGDTDE